MALLRNTHYEDPIPPIDVIYVTFIFGIITLNANNLMQSPIRMESMSRKGMQQIMAESLKRVTDVDLTIHFNSKGKN